MSDHEARKKQLADMFSSEEQSTPGSEPSYVRTGASKDIFFNVFANPNHCPEGETTDTGTVAVNKHLKCINQAMGDFWEINVVRKQPNGVMPTQAHLSDAGWDLYSCESKTILPSGRKTINTGISLAIPNSFVGLIWPRSGLAVQKGIDVLAGVIDSGYRGEIKVCLLNTGAMPVTIEVGDRIAQILFQEVPKFKLIEITDLSETDRNSGGFGSSGS
jgi:dUTP pyrophosphatase